VRIAIVYDCLFPHTIGGAERWYRSLAERLGGRHEMTYLTRRQWGDQGPGTPFPALPVAPGGELYTASGRRRIGPPLRFGMGVFWHLLRHGRGYDAVHCASFPYFSVLAAWLALLLTRSRARLIVDWHEVWGRDYWRSYLGPLAGRIGFAVERLCVRRPDLSFTFSKLAEGRLRELGHRAPIVRLTGEYAEDAGARRLLEQPRHEGPPLVVSAGRHIPEKRVPLVPAAIAAARPALPELACVILGDGPDAGVTRELVGKLGLGDAIEMPGRVPPERVSQEIARASCLLHPSEREGYGMVVVEAASLGTPSIVVAGSENAATELVEPGENGFIANSADPEELGRLVTSVVEGGDRLRASTLEWYERHRDELSIEGSLRRVEASYAGELADEELAAQARS
jgi:glycosyltransferase involved in cell wall biosynthesis